jgi:cytoskeletal protein RodZ
VQVPEEEIAFEQQKQRMARIFLFAVAIMLAAAAVLVYVLLRNRPGTETPAEAAGAQMVTPAAPPASGTAAGQATASQPVSAAPAGPAATTAGPMRLELHPSGPCWVSVEADGRVVLARMMQPGEREALTVRDSVEITVGDAAAFAFTIDGRAGRSLGGAAEVKTARITRATLSEFVR